jgi:hypothetical protein
VVTSAPRPTSRAGAAVRTLITRRWRSTLQGRSPRHHGRSSAMSAELNRRSAQSHRARALRGRSRARGRPAPGRARHRAAAAPGCRDGPAGRHGESSPQRASFPPTRDGGSAPRTGDLLSVCQQLLEPTGLTREGACGRCGGWVTCRSRPRGWRRIEPDRVGCPVGLQCANGTGGPVSSPRPARTGGRAGRRR